jgi:hypothetical protein
MSSSAAAAALGTSIRQQKLWWLILEILIPSTIVLTRSHGGRGRAGVALSCTQLPAFCSEPATRTNNLTAKMQGWYGVPE